MKRAYLALAIAAAFIAVIVAPAKAQTRSDKTPEALALQNFGKGEADWTNDVRASFAETLHQYCESVLTQAPRNTPKEDQWAESEERDAKFPQTERLNRLVNSVEYIRRAFRHILTECTALTTKLMELKASPAEQVLLWVRLSGLFGIEDFIWDYAEVLGLLSPKACDFMKTLPRKLFDPALTLPSPLPHDPNNFCSWHTVNSIIILHAVIPLLERMVAQSR